LNMPMPSLAMPPSTPRMTERYPTTDARTSSASSRALQQQQQRQQEETVVGLVQHARYTARVLVCYCCQRRFLLLRSSALSLTKCRLVHDALPRAGVILTHFDDEFLPSACAH
jgi:hypothetical protein